MKTSNWSKISELYKENGYSDEIIMNIEWMESQHPFTEDLLEEYRYVQPDGELFSEHSLEIIIALHNIESLLKAQKDITCDIEENLKKLVKLSFQKDESADDFLFDEDAF